MGSRNYLKIIDFVTYIKLQQYLARNVKHAKTQFERIQKRILDIINRKGQRITLITARHARNSKCAIEVFKCQNRLSKNLFKEYFNKIQH